MSKFFWGHKDDDSKIVWMSWTGMGRSKSQGGLGFRDLVSFNLALLAKQGWRLLQFPDSLVARVFKEKYFSQSSFLEASVGSHPSYAWRSLCNSRHLLAVGLRWRVGNGHSIKIWEDRWIPCPTSFKIQSPVSILPHNAKVSELIDASTRWWNIPLIQSIFTEEEVECICGLPFSLGGYLDKLIWTSTPSDVFTVCSAYHLEKERTS